VPEVRTVHAEPSGLVRIVPAVPTATYCPLPKPTPYRVFCVPLFWMFQVVPSVLVTMTPRLADVHVPVTTMGADVGILVAYGHELRARRRVARVMPFR